MMETGFSGTFNGCLGSGGRAGALVDPSNPPAKKSKNWNFFDPFFRGGFEGRLGVEFCFQIPLDVVFLVVSLIHDNLIYIFFRMMWKLYKSCPEAR